MGFSDWFWTNTSVRGWQARDGRQACWDWTPTALFHRGSRTCTWVRARQRASVVTMLVSGRPDRAEGRRERRAAHRRPGFRTHRKDAHTPTGTALRPGGFLLCTQQCLIGANVTLWEVGRGLESQVWECTAWGEFGVHERQKSQSLCVASNIWSAAAAAVDGLSRLGSYSGSSKEHR